MDQHELTRKQLGKYLEQCHENSLRFIEIVTNAAGDQMVIDGVHFNPELISVEIICHLAAKSLNMDEKELYANYIDLMVLEKMVEMTDTSVTV